jgi:hypothetical protein
LITDWKTDMLIYSVRTRLFPAPLIPARFAPALMFPRVICSTQVFPISLIPHACYTSVPPHGMSPEVRVRAQLVFP